jgi:hypothetical protein
LLLLSEGQCLSGFPSTSPGALCAPFHFFPSPLLFPIEKGQIKMLHPIYLIYEIHAKMFPFFAYTKRIGGQSSKKGSSLARKEKDRQVEGQSSHNNHLHTSTSRNKAAQSERHNGTSLARQHGTTQPVASKEKKVSCH